MMHRNRQHYAVNVSIPELAEKLTEHTWCGCNGFRTPGGSLWLNDATSGDGAQEYGVFRLINGELRQVESITASWCSADKIAEYARQADAGEWDHYHYSTYPRPVQTPEEHDRCVHCA